MASTLKPVSAFRDATTKQLQLFYQKPIAKVSAELFATLGAVIALAVFAIRPTLLTMSQLLKDIEDRKKTSADLTKKIAALSTLSTEYPSVKNDIVLLHTVIPSTPDFEGFMRRLERVAADRSLLIVSLQVATLPKETTDTQRAPELTAFTVSVNFRGDYSQVRDVLNDLLTIDRFVTVDSIVLNAKRDEIAKSNVLLTTVNLRIAYFGTPPQTVRQGGQR